MGNTFKSLGRSIKAAGRKATVAAATAIGGPVAGVVAGGIYDKVVKALQIIAKRFALLAASAAILMVGVLVLIGVFIMFILFIINNSAYVVPLGDIFRQGGVQGPWQTINVGASCPIPNGVILTGSYGSPYGTTQHGTNRYWDSLAGRYVCSSYELPYQGCLSPNAGSCYDMGKGCFARQSGDYCIDTKGSCSNYGLATDFIYPGIQQAGQLVFLPYIEGESVTWKVDAVFPGTQGRGVMSAVYQGSVYQVYVTHLQNSPVGGQSGDPFGALYPLGTPHLHIELRIDGVFVPPDFMCLGSNNIPGGESQ